MTIEGANQLVYVPELLGGDYVLKVEASGVPDVRAGDWVTVTQADVAEPGRVVIAQDAGGRHTAVMRAPVVDGFRVVAVVVGLYRRLA